MPAPAHAHPYSGKAQGLGSHPPLTIPSLPGSTPQVMKILMEFNAFDGTLQNSKK